MRFILADIKFALALIALKVVFLQLLKKYFI